ncbi:uncharacterized protein LOC116259496 [Nymphaea colorata]|nr:uncharacterized protein LOC116259496 [Nymphaea colorata]
MPIPTPITFVDPWKNFFHANATSDINTYSSRGRLIVVECHRTDKTDAADANASHWPGQSPPKLPSEFRSARGHSLLQNEIHLIIWHIRKMLCVSLNNPILIHKYLGAMLKILAAYQIWEWSASPLKMVLSWN